MTAPSLLPLAAVLALGWLGLHQLVRAAAVRRAEFAALRTEAEATARLDVRLDERLERTRPARWLRRRLAAAAIRLSPVQFLLAVLGVALAVLAVAGLLVPPPVPAVLAVASIAGSWAFLGARRTRRRAMFVEQIAEIAEILGNLGFAGYSLPTALGLAPAELPEPAASELRAVASGMALGQPVVDALGDLLERMPSRELRVLVSTLSIQMRSGGDTVGAMRSIAATLEARKEVLDEVNTIVNKSRSSVRGLIVLAAAGMLLLQVVLPEGVRLLFVRPVGQVILLVCCTAVTVGVVLVGRASRLEV